MNSLRLVVALLFAGLYAALIIDGLVRGSFEGPVAAMTPVATLAITYLLGIETIKAWHRRNGNNGA